MNMLDLPVLTDININQYPSSKTLVQTKQLIKRAKFDTVVMICSIRERDFHLSLLLEKRTNQAFILSVSVCSVTGGELFEDIVAREYYSEADARYSMSALLWDMCYVLLVDFPPR